MPRSRAAVFAVRNADVPEAGNVLLHPRHTMTVLTQLPPFVRGFMLWWWATATWWIPMLLILALWRHVFRKFPLNYDPLYWGVVFPIGMYTVGTLRLSHAVDAPYLANTSLASSYTSRS